MKLILKGSRQAELYRSYYLPGLFWLESIFWIKVAGQPNRSGGSGDIAGRRLASPGQRCVKSEEFRLYRNPADWFSKVVAVMPSNLGRDLQDCCNLIQNDYSLIGDRQPCSEFSERT